MRQKGMGTYFHDFHSNVEKSRNEMLVLIVLGKLRDWESPSRCLLMPFPRLYKWSSRRRDTALKRGSRYVDAVFKNALKIHPCLLL